MFTFKTCFRRKRRSTVCKLFGNYTRLLINKRKREEYYDVQPDRFVLWRSCRTILVLILILIAVFWRYIQGCFKNITPSPPPPTKPELFINCNSSQTCFRTLFWDNLKFFSFRWGFSSPLKIGIIEKFKCTPIVWHFILKIITRKNKLRASNIFVTI